MHCPFCRHTDTRVVDSRVADDGTAIRRRRQCPELRPAVHHRRARAADRDQALRRDRAVQPRQGDRRRPQGLPGPPGHRGRPGLLGQPVEDALRGEGAAEIAGPRGRPGDPRPAARARRGRLPAVRERLPGVRAPPTTSRPRSRCCAPSASRRRRAALGGRRRATAPRDPAADHRPPGASWGSTRAGRTTVGAADPQSTSTSRTTDDQRDTTRDTRSSA